MRGILDGFTSGSRASFGRPGRVSTALLGLFLVLSTACGSGVVQTTQGPRPAAEVIAQDTAADILVILKDGYKQASALHDSLAGQEDPAKHAKRRQQLVSFLAGLKAAGNSLEAWKAGTSGAPTAEVLRPLAKALPDFLALAGELGALKPDQVERVKAFLKPILELVEMRHRPNRILSRAA